MRNIFYLAVIALVSLGISSCNQEGEDPIICSLPPSVMHILVNKNSERYQDFVDSNGKLDKENVYFYKMLDNNKAEKIPFYFTPSYKVPDSNQTYALLSFTKNDFFKTYFNGEKQTFYLANKGKTDTIVFEGNLSHTECGMTSKLVYSSVNEKPEEGFNDYNLHIIYLVK